MKYAVWTGSAWRNETVDSVGDVGRYSSLVLRNDEPYISYIDYTNNALRYAEPPRDGWTINLLGGNAGSDTAYVFESTGVPHIVTYDIINHALIHYYRVWSGMALQYIGQSRTA